MKEEAAEVYLHKICQLQLLCGLYARITTVSYPLKVVAICNCHKNAEIMLNCCDHYVFPHKIITAFFNPIIYVHVRMSIELTLLYSAECALRTHVAHFLKHFLCLATSLALHGMQFPGFFVIFSSEL